MTRNEQDIRRRTIKRVKRRHIIIPAIWAKRILKQITVENQEDKVREE